MTLPLYLVHGWSYDHNFWTPMLRHLPEHTAICTDAGYYGESLIPSLPTTPFLAIGHSAGVLDLLTHPLPHCVGIVSFNGFARFSAAPDHAHGIPQRIITRMRRQLTQDPPKTLHNFREQCGDHSPIPNTPNVIRLDHGLDQLETRDARSKAAQWGERLFWLTGDHDPLTPARVGFQTGHGTSQPGGHCLPQEHPEDCAALIRKALHITGQASC